MSTRERTTTGGIIGDPAGAFTPPATGGCCGSAPASGSESEASLEGSCCGTVAEAAESGDCCGQTAKAQAIASGAGCCG